MGMPHIDDLRLFDSCVTLGRTCLPQVPELTVEGLVEVMDRHDIAEALVQSNEARLVYPRRRGNERLVKELAGAARLHPVWALSPPPGPDPKGMRALVDEMLSAGVRVARLMMGQVPPLHWMWRGLCEALEARRVVCLVDFAPLRHGPTNHPGDSLMIDKLGEIAAANPDLPLILSHLSGGLGVAAPTIPLMHRAGNLRIDTTGVVDYWRNVAAGLGPERVVFATGMPFYDPATFISNVQYDETLDAEAKALICGGNLRRLMEAVG